VPGYHRRHSHLFLHHDNKTPIQAEDEKGRTETAKTGRREMKNTKSDMFDFLGSKINYKERMKNTLLTICPSRNRPERLKTMLDSFKRTKSKTTDIVIYVSEDDPQLEVYKLLMSKYEPKDLLIIGPRRYLSEAINYCVKISPGYDFYQEVNDDHVYKTRGWDRILISEINRSGNGWGIAFGRDLLNDKINKKLPSAAVISANVIKYLGHFFYPEIKHTYVDNYLRDIGEGMGRLFYCPKAIIEHRHFLNGKSPIDENYKWVTSKEAMDQGRIAYETWCKNERDKEIGKLNTAILGI
jgi:hypothetical protein